MGGPRDTLTTIRKDALYDFLYDNDYPAWLLNQSQGITSRRRQIQEWIMKIHTGETQASATPNWTWDQRERLGQQYLEELAEDMLRCLAPSRGQSKRVELVTELKRRLELDGYKYNKGVLLRPETDVLDVQEEQGVLRNLFRKLGLANEETAFHHLKLSEDHYVAERWDDSISNSRKFFESVMQEVAASRSRSVEGAELSQKTYDRPFAVRDYLEREGLLESKEKETVAKVYGLLSHTGGHPYMAENDQARLLRHLALTLSQFVMLRYQGSKTSLASASA